MQSVGSATAIAIEYDMVYHYGYYGLCVDKTCWLDVDLLGLCSIQIRRLA
jgi:hypothetical protein